MYDVGFYGGKFLPFHRGHLNCILQAASMCKKLYVVLMYNGQDEIEALGEETRFGNKYLTPHIRELALRRELNCYPNIEVVPYDCKEPDEKAIQEGKHPWHYECEDMVSIMGEFDACFSSELEYHELFRKFYPFADSVILDEDRSVMPISGTQLRNMSVSEAYDYLPRAYQQFVNKTVLCVGTCSCGKTTLVRKLASYYNTSFSEEQGRKVSQSFKNISSPGIEYYNEFICSQYLDNERARKTANKVAFLDTDSIITMFYANLYEEGELKAGEGIAQDTEYDLVLFFEPTVPFVADGMRTHREEAQRWELSDRLKQVYLDRFGDKVRILNGTYLENYNAAIQYVDDMLR